jgi:hypothetical protein
VNIRASKDVEFLVVELGNVLQVFLDPRKRRIPLERL